MERKPEIVVMERHRMEFQCTKLSQSQSQSQSPDQNQSLGRDSSQYSNRGLTKSLHSQRKTSARKNDAKDGRAKRLLAGVTLALCPGLAFPTPQDFPDQEIREIATHGTAEGIYIVTASLERSLDGCGGPFFLPATHPLLNQNLSIALAAMYAKSRVQLEVDGCTSSGAMKMRGVRVTR